MDRVDICHYCKKGYIVSKHGQRFCSRLCRKAYLRNIKWQSNNRKKGKLCAICGFNLLVDLHHERDAEGKLLEEIYLCPNHHALITRKSISLKELKELSQSVTSEITALDKTIDNLLTYRYKNYARNPEIESLERERIHGVPISKQAASYPQEKAIIKK